MTRAPSVLSLGGCLVQGAPSSLAIVSTVRSGSDRAVPVDPRPCPLRHVPALGGSGIPRAGRGSWSGTARDRARTSGSARRCSDRWGGDFADPGWQGGPEAERPSRRPPRRWERARRPAAAGRVARRRSGRAPKGRSTVVAPLAPVIAVPSSAPRRRRR